MADKSRNEQYDVVAQAEEVLRLYTKRCFDSARRRREQKAKKRLRGRLIVIGCCLCLLGGAAVLAVMNTL